MSQQPQTRSTGEDPFTLARTITDATRAGRAAEAGSAVDQLLASTSPGDRLRLATVDALVALGRAEEAIAVCDAVADAAPGEAPPLRFKSRVAEAAGRTDDLIAALSRLVALARSADDLHTVHGHVLSQRWHTLPLADLARRIGLDPREKTSIKLGLFLIMCERFDEARPYLDNLPPARLENPDVAIALSILCTLEERQELAGKLTAKALTRRPFISRSVGRGEAGLLVLIDLLHGMFTREHRRLGADAYAHGNYISELAPGRLDLHFLHFQSPNVDAVVDRLPRVDVLLSNMSWGELAPDEWLFDRFDRFRDRLGVPVINGPRQHAAMARHVNYDRWGAATEFIFPKTLRIENRLDRVEENAEMLMKAFRPPFILRPAFTQAGGGMVLVHSRAEVTAALRDTPYRDLFAIQYHTTTHHDGWYRKYRVGVIDKRPTVLRIDVNSDWMVHRDKLGTGYRVSDAILEEEKALQADYKKVLSTEACQMIERIAEEGPLDIFGFDFGFTEEGQPIIFEANAAMNLVHYRFLARFPHFHDQVARMQRAIEDAVLRRVRR